MTVVAKGRADRPRWASSRAVEWAVRGLSWLSVLALAALLLTIVVNVIARYIFASPLLGGNEVMQLGLVTMVTLALLPAVHDEIHIRVDVLDARIGKWGRYVGDVLTRTVSMFVLGALVVRAWTQAKDAAEFGDATNMLAIPLWPFYGLIVLGGALYALMLAIQLVDLLRRGATDDV